MAKQTVMSQIGRVLGELSTDLERLGLALCGDPAICAKFVGTLQEIDRISQAQRELSVIVAHPDPQSAIFLRGLNA